MVKSKKGKMLYSQGNVSAQNACHEDLYKHYSDKGGLGSQTVKEKEKNE